MLPIPTPYEVEDEAPLAATLRASRTAQARWSETPLAQRLSVVRAVRSRLVERADRIAGLSGRDGTQARAETLAAEVLPLADALRFLERNAKSILRTRRPGPRRPWRSRRLEIRREALGVVLVIGPGNYPLFLPGVQVAQALAAGNSVLLKPAPGGKRAAFALQALFLDGGLDPALFVVLPDAVEAARAAIREGVDHVVLTGSATTGRAVLHDLAPRLTPATLELSGCDAVFVRPDADLGLLVRALRFGLTLNGSRTCIAPRRVFVPRAMQGRLTSALADALGDVPPVTLDPRTATRVTSLVREATAEGALVVAGEPPRRGRMRPVVLADADPRMAIARSDIFAPVLSLIPVDGDEDALAKAAQCPYALGATVFGRREGALALSGRIRAGVVLVNDMIAPTADPRVPFGGRGVSGYGTTRGPEGLLSMTALKAVIETRARSRRHLDGLRGDEDPLFLAWLETAHAGTWTQRIRGALALVREGMRYARATRSEEETSHEAEA